MRTRSLTAALAFLLCARLAAPLDARVTPLPRTTPEAEGLSSAQLLAFVEALESKIDAVHSVMVLRHGHVVAEGWWSPFAKDDPHVMFSLSKSFTSTAVGLAVSEGKLSVDDPVLKFFPEDAPAEPSANLKAMRVRDLLAMSTGQHAEDMQKFSFGEAGLTKTFLGLPVAHKPGTHFWYNTPATYMASAIVKKATGEDIFDYLGPRLFTPLGIEHPTWDKSKDGISLGGYGLRVKTEDVARFGQLYLRKGAWGGKQIVPAAWIAAATSRQVSNGSNPDSDWEQGYGYQFWRCRHGVYRGDGAFGQFCVVMPEQDMVVAITSGTRDLQGVLNVVWDHVLPAAKPQALPADAAGKARLGTKLANLVLPVTPGASTSGTAAKVSGKTYDFPANDDKIESLRVDFGADGAATLVVTREGKESRILVGSAAWKRGGTAFALDGTPERAAASGAWTADDTYTARVYLHDTPFRVTNTLRFADDQLFFDREQNVILGDAPTKRPELVGRARP
jgi:CubicO group peptidase (beta-lactamase class C family)